MWSVARAAAFTCSARMAGACSQCARDTAVPDGPSTALGWSLAMQDDASIAVHGGLWVGPGRSTGRPSCQSCSTFKCEFYRKIRAKKFVQRQHQGPPLAPSLQGPGGAPLGHASRDQASSAGRGDGPWSLWTIQGTRARVSCRRRHWGPQAVGALGPRGCPSRGGPGLKMGSAGPVGSSVGVALPSESWIGVGRGRGRAPRVLARVRYLGEAFEDRAHCPPRYRSQLASAKLRVS